MCPSTSACMFNSFYSRLCLPCRGAQTPRVRVTPASPTADSCLPSCLPASLLGRAGHMAGPLRTGDHVLDALHGGQRAADVAHHIHAVRGHAADAGEARGHRGHPGEPERASRQQGWGWSRESGVGLEEGRCRAKAERRERRMQSRDKVYKVKGRGTQTSNIIRALAAAVVATGRFFFPDARSDISRMYQ